MNRSSVHVHHEISSPSTAGLLAALLLACSSFCACVPRATGTAESPDGSSELKRSPHRMPRHECLGSGCGPMPEKRDRK
jgi:hypothetical protein